VLNPTVWLC